MTSPELLLSCLPRIQSPLCCSQRSSRPLEPLPLLSLCPHLASPPMLQAIGPSVESALAFALAVCT